MLQLDDRRVAQPPVPVIRVQNIQPSVPLSAAGARRASSRFFSDDLDKTDLRRINKSIGHRFAKGSGLCGLSMTEG